ncbi:MAG: ABC transporter ATP-binding protein [Aureliella sp.]
MIQHNQASLSVDDAHFAFGDLQALAGMSLQLFPGELLGLLGPNGAGKTTLINCITGRRRLDRGRIHVHLPGRLEDCLGIVPQELAIYSDLTVGQNLAIFGKLQGLSSLLLAERIHDALAWANLEDRKGATAGSLSGGMQRRLNIACSVLHRPQILLLDEPTVGVDPQSRECIYGMLDSLLTQGTAILLTTHHLDEAQTRCDRIAICDQGRMLNSGTFEELLSRTIGTSQQLSIQFSDEVERVPAPLRLSESKREAHGLIDDTVRQLPELLLALRCSDTAIERLTLREPTLQHLFLHLTGKELRE